MTSGSLPDPLPWSWGRLRDPGAAERQAWSALAVLHLLGDVILLLKDLAGDARVPSRAKLVAGAAVVYLLSPVDLVPTWLPVGGRRGGVGSKVDDVTVAAYAFRTLLTAAGFDLVRERWRGSDEGLVLLLSLAGVQE